MPKTFVQTLFAKVSDDYIRTENWNPLRDSVATLPVSAFSFFWMTVSEHANVHEARKARTKDQRVARHPSGSYASYVICKTTGKKWYVFDNAITPRAEIEAAAISRVKDIARRRDTIKEAQ